jgi:hypothetical protein
MKVSRPSAQRRKVKEAYLENLEQSSFLRDELARAEEIYAAYVGLRVKNGGAASVRLVPGQIGQEENGVNRVEATAA